MPTNLRNGRARWRRRRPYHVQPVLTVELLGAYFETAAEAKAFARRLAARHQVTVAVWEDVAGGSPETRLVETIEVRYTLTDGPDRAA